MSDPPALGVRALTVRRGGRTVVARFDLDAEIGEIVGVTGPNGAGKSSALAAVAGLLPAQGDVRLAGRPVLGVSPQRMLRHGLALVHQRRHLFAALTVRRNLELGGTVVGDHDEVVARVEASLRDEPLLAARADVAAGALSGGEQSLLALARALIARPSVLLLDEPLAGVSAATRGSVLDRIAAATSNAAVVLVEHDAAAIDALAGRTISLSAPGAGRPRP